MQCKTLYPFLVIKYKVPIHPGYIFLPQLAAGIFGHLKDIVLSHVQQEPTPDLSPDTLNALSALMVAQAQEAIYRKAAAGKDIEGNLTVFLYTLVHTVSMI